MKTKLFFVVCLFMFWLSGMAQDMNYNTFPNALASVEDSVQISWGARWGRVNLTQPKTPKGVSVQEKKSYDNFPEHVGVGNFILDLRMRFARDTTSLVSHDGLGGINLSLLRSRVYAGYQYNRPWWFVSGRIGFEVLRDPQGPYQSGSKRFSDKILLVGSEFGFTPPWKEKMFSLRTLVEYDFGQFGWYVSALGTARVYHACDTDFLLGCHFDGIWGCGLHTSLRREKGVLYFSTFSNQFKFQEQKFPEQRIGMEKGFALGFQVNIQ